MGRPKRSERQMFYDEFADMDVADQLAALEILTELNRQKRRGRLETKPEQIELKEAEV